MISFSRYINITSGVGAGQGVRRRDFILRVVTDSTLFEAGMTYEFANIDALSFFLGAGYQDMPEYKRAQIYFGFVNKNVQRPKKISFTRYISTTGGTAPKIVGDTSAKSIDSLKKSAGSITFVVGGVPTTVSPIDTSAAVSYAAVATAINTALAALDSSAPAELKTGTVTYNTQTNQYIFVAGGATGASPAITVIAGGTNDLAQPMGWGTGQGTYVPGYDQDTPLTAIVRSAAGSSNFGSFVYQVSTFNTDTPIPPDDQIVAVSSWVKAQNVKYLFCLGVTPANANRISGITKGYAGTALVLYSPVIANDYSDQIPAEILAATNYNTKNSVQNFMFYQFPTRATTVSDDPTADAMDAIRVNYVGVTETAGQQLAFFQRGILQGGSQDPVDMNTYCNEMWLKDDIGAGFMSMLLNAPRVPANQEGRSSGLAVLQASVDRAKDNGVISAGKELNVDQRAYITEMTANDRAWRQVETIGYYMDVFFTTQVTTDGRTETVMNYYLIYGKDDVIRQVIGSDVLI